MDKYTIAPRSSTEKVVIDGFFDGQFVVRYARRLLNTIVYTPARAKNGVSITVDDMLDTWIKQNGVCPITGWRMTAPLDPLHPGGRDPRRMSIDRIHSPIGYIPGNIRWISHIANAAKFAFEEDDLIEFCIAVAENEIAKRVVESDFCGTLLR